MRWWLNPLCTMPTCFVESLHATPLARLGYIINLISSQAVFALFAWYCMHSQWSNSKCQFYNFWFDLTRARTHNLQHSSRACQQIRMHLTGPGCSVVLTISYQHENSSILFTLTYKQSCQNQFPLAYRFQIINIF